MDFDAIPEEDERLAHAIIGAAIEVHRLLGPGFLESIYERALCHELALRGVAFERQKELIVRYKDLGIPGQRLDLLVGGRVIVDLKTVDNLAPIHHAQVLSYLKSTGLRLGLLINFKTLVLRDGIKRIIH
jgi:GxxExxY protein